MSIEFEPYSHAHKQDPYAVYRELREFAPVHFARGSGTWVFSRYDDVDWILRNPELFSSKTMRRGRLIGVRTLSKAQLLRFAFRFFAHLRAMPRTVVRSRMLITEDGDVHAPMRALVNRGFTPRRIAAWETRIRELVTECMRSLPARTPLGDPDRSSLGCASLSAAGPLAARRHFDLMEDLAIPLPVSVIAEMLGVDPARHADFKRWSDAIIQGGTGSGIADLAGSGMIAAMGELRRYLRPLVRARRREPGDDLLGMLVGSEYGEVGLSDFEIFMFVLLLLIAGNETTTNLLGNAVDALLAHPEQLALVNADPSRVPALVEETLRWDTPVQFLTRVASADVERHGVRIPRGAPIVALLGSANRDERRFAHPDRFDVDRDSRGHVAFGFGNHFCLGASLARLEARAALEALVPELPGLVRARPEVEFLDSYLIRGRSRLELRAAA